MQLKVQLKFNSAQADGIRELSKALQISETELCRLASLKALADAYKLQAQEDEKNAAVSRNNTITPEHQRVVDLGNAEPNSATLPDQADAGSNS